jgi:hypothetical protein
VSRARLLAARVPGIRRLDIVTFLSLDLSMIDGPRCRERRWRGREQVVNKQTPCIAQLRLRERRALRAQFELRMVLVDGAFH